MASPQSVLPSALSKKKVQLLAASDGPPAEPEPKKGASQELPNSFYVEDGKPDATPAATPEAAPAAAPAPSTPPAEAPAVDPSTLSSDEQVQYWRGEAERNEQRWKSFQGQWPSREGELKDQISALEKRLDEADSPAAKPAEPLKFDVDMTEEERTKYHESATFITKVATQVANQAIVHMMERVEALEAQLGGVSQSIKDTKNSVADSSEAVFDASVRAAIEDLDALTQHPGWRPYASRVLPYTGESIGAHLMAAYKRQDLKSVKTIMTEFRTAINADPASATLEDLATPTGGGGGASNGANGSGKKADKRLKFSMRKQASDDFRKGRIDIARFTKIKLAFKEAEAKGLVDYDA